MTYKASVGREAFSAFNITEHKDATINPFSWDLLCSSVLKEVEWSYFFDKVILTARMNHSYSHIWCFQQPSLSSQSYYLPADLDLQLVVCFLELNNSGQLKSIPTYIMKMAAPELIWIHISFLLETSAMTLLKHLSNIRLNTLLVLTWLEDNYFLLVRKQNNLYSEIDLKMENVSKRFYLFNMKVDFFKMR